MPKQLPPVSMIISKFSDHSTSTQKVDITLAVIINSFNRVQLLKEALSSVLENVQHTVQPSAIIIFDAGSTDGSLECIQEMASQVQTPAIFCLVSSVTTQNSFSAGCNAAVCFAAEQFPNLKYCFFFETDNLILNPSALPLAIQLLEQEQRMAAVGFTVERRDRQKTGFGNRFPTPFSFLIGQQIAQAFRLDQMPIKEWQSFEQTSWGVSDVVYTSPLLVRYKAWQAIGGMDSERFPFSDSDLDWCWMAAKSGWSVAVLDISGVIHDSQNQDSSWSENRVMDFHRARFQLLTKHYGHSMNWLKPLLFMRHNVEFILLKIFTPKTERVMRSLQQRQILMQSVFNGYESC